MRTKELLGTLQEEMENDRRNPEHEKQYAKYFQVRTTPARGTRVTANDEVIEEAKKNHGYFVLLSNEVRDLIKALEIYRNKALVEKAFVNPKERLNFSRTSVSSDRSLGESYGVGEVTKLQAELYETMDIHLFS